MRKFILLLFFSQWTPLHYSATNGRLEVARFLVESKADVAARGRCFSPPPSHHLSLTICLAAVATLHSHAPLLTTKSTLLHTCAASALLNDAPPRAAAAQIKSSSCSRRRCCKGGGELEEAGFTYRLKPKQGFVFPVDLGFLSHETHPPTVLQ